MILITRPIVEAVELKKLLKQKNIQSLIEPLTSFKFLNRKINFNENSFYICASQRCVESLALIKNIKNIHLIVVGKKVAKRLTENNFKNILFIANDTKQLIKWIRKKDNRLKQYIYLSGNIINNDFINNLKKSQISFKRKIIYQTIFKKSLKLITIKNIKQNKIKSVLFYSRTSVDVYFRLLKKYEITEKSQNQLFFVLSSRIAESLRKYKLKRGVIKISPNPDQSSIISLIGSNKQLINN